MAKHKRSNPKLVARYCSELAEAHRWFHRHCGRMDALTERRGSIVREAAEKLTREDNAVVYGYGRALWDASWNTFEWRLGFEDMATSKPSRTPPDKGGWDYSTALPTHGGHFHPTGELATDWFRLDHGQGSLHPADKKL